MTPWVSTTTMSIFVHATVWDCAEAAVDVLLRAMELPEDVREAPWAVRRRRDGVGGGGEGVGVLRGGGTQLGARQGIAGIVIADVECSGAAAI